MGETLIIMQVVINLLESQLTDPPARSAQWSTHLRTQLTAETVPPAAHKTRG